MMDINRVKQLFLQSKGMQGELDNSNKRLERLVDKLFNSYDWDKLEEELGA